CLLGLVVAASLFAPALTVYDPLKPSFSQRLVPPRGLGGASAHLLGTDNLGRDIPAPPLYRGRISPPLTVGGGALPTLPGGRWGSPRAGAARRATPSSCGWRTCSSPSLSSCSPSRSWRSWEPTRSLLWAGLRSPAGWSSPPPFGRLLSPSSSPASSRPRPTPGRGSRAP